MWKGLSIGYPYDLICPIHSLAVLKHNSNELF
jgi:hypothetical protein